MQSREDASMTVAFLTPLPTLRRRNAPSWHHSCMCTATAATNSDAEVVIVGAGLAGLATARHLAAAGVSAKVYEASDDVGGRVRTDLVDGYVLDRGFAVFIEGYPEQRRMLDYNALDLKPLLPGALVRHGDGWYPVSDPFRAPLLAVQGILSPVGSLTDKLRVLSLRSHLLSLSQEQIDALSNVSTFEYLQKFGFSAAMIERFFAPFYRGIFLAPLERQSASMFAFVFRQFATAPASLPAAGIGAVAQQLAKGVDVSLNSPVLNISDGRVTFADGTIVECDNIVVATDGPTAARLLGVSTPPSRAVSCVYLTSKYPPPPAIDMPILCLNGTGSGCVNNMYIPTSLCPAWAPEGKTLISTTVLGSDVDEVVVKSQLSQWFGKDVVDEWDILKVYSIDHAQSAQEPPVFSHDTQVSEGLFVCGDHRNTPTVNGALVSGREAANRVMGSLKLRNEVTTR